MDKADCHQIGRVLPLEKVEHLVPGSDDYNDDCNDMVIFMIDSAFTLNFCWTSGPHEGSCGGNILHNHQRIYLLK